MTSVNKSRIAILTCNRLTRKLREKEEDKQLQFCKYLSSEEKISYYVWKGLIGVINWSNQKTEF